MKLSSSNAVVAKYYRSRHARTTELSNGNVDITQRHSASRPTTHNGEIKSAKDINIKLTVIKFGVNLSLPEQG